MQKILSNYPKSAQKSTDIILKRAQNVWCYPKGAQNTMDIILQSAQKSFQTILKVRKNLYISFSKVHKIFSNYPKSAQKSVGIILKIAGKSFKLS